MTALQFTVAVALAGLWVPGLSAVVGKSSGTHRSSETSLLKPETIAAIKDQVAETAETSLIKPLVFNQELLLCNAYDSPMPMTVKQNGRLSEHSIPFKKCSEVVARVKAKDRLDVDFGGIGQGSFEIGEIPATDSFLLLVVEKRDTTSPLVAFKSYAFPAQTEGDEAHLAVIDAFQGSSNMPTLRMEDHVTGKEAAMFSKRIEQLHFNHIYNVEQGTYDASIIDHTFEDKEFQVVKGLKKKLRLQKNKNYVVLRVGQGKDAEQTLAVYPEAESGAFRSTVAALAVCVAFHVLKDAIESFPLLQLV